jgi:lipopolysaccharide transport protein LptA
MRVSKGICSVLIGVAFAGMAGAQGSAAAADLLNELRKPAPTSVKPMPSSPVVAKPAPAVRAQPVTVATPPSVVVPPPVVTPPSVVVAPPVAGVTPPEVVVAPPVVVAPTNVPVLVEGSEKPTVTLTQPKKKKAGSSFLTKAGSSTNAPARETIITSDKIDFDYKEGVILFDDHVVVDDPQFVMRSDRLLVFMESTNDVSQVMAIGNVIFSNEMRSATCDKAIYTRKDGQVVLTGDVRLKTEGETTGEVRGKKVVIWVDDERVEVLDGASITLPPGAFKKASDQEKKAMKPGEKTDAKPDDKKEVSPGK